MQPPRRAPLSAGAAATRLGIAATADALAAAQRILAVIILFVAADAESAAAAEPRAGAVAAALGTHRICSGGQFVFTAGRRAPAALPASLPSAAFAAIVTAAFAEQYGIQ